MAEFLRRGSADWNEIIRRFRNKEYDRFSYDAQSILDANPEWKRKYESVAFEYSLRNIVSNLYLQAPPKILKDGSVVRNSYDIHPEHPEMTPSGERFVTGHRRWKTPSHQITWVDSSANQNNRVTVFNQQLPGDINKHYKIRIEDSGKTLVKTYKWPEEFLSEALILNGHKFEDGSPFYTSDHNKVVAFREHVKELRQDKSDTPVESICVTKLSIQCEEQFARTEVPRPIYSGVFIDKDSTNKVKVLGVELMGMRSNYETQKVEEEVDISEDSKPPAAPAAARQRASSGVTQQRRPQQAAGHHQPMEGVEPIAQQGTGPRWQQQPQQPMGYHQQQQRQQPMGHHQQQQRQQPMGHHQQHQHQPPPPPPATWDAQAQKWIQAEWSSKFGVWIYPGSTAKMPAQGSAKQHDLQTSYQMCAQEQRELRQAEERRLEEQRRLEEMRRLAAEQDRLAEQARLLEERQRQTEQDLGDKAQEEQRRLAAEQDRVAEQARLLEERQRQAEQDFGDRAQQVQKEMEATNRKAAELEAEKEAYARKAKEVEELAEDVARKKRILQDQQQQMHHDMQMKQNEQSRLAQKLKKQELEQAEKDLEQAEQEEELQQRTQEQAMQEEELQRRLQEQEQLRKELEKQQRDLDNQKLAIGMKQFVPTDRQGSKKRRACMNYADGTYTVVSDEDGEDEGIDSSQVRERARNLLELAEKRGRDDSSWGTSLGETADFSTLRDSQGSKFDSSSRNNDDEGGTNSGSIDMDTSKEDSQLEEIVEEDGIVVEEEDGDVVVVGTD